MDTPAEKMMVLYEKMKKGDVSALAEILNREYAKKGVRKSAEYWDNTLRQEEADEYTNRYYSLRQVGDNKYVLEVDADIDINTWEETNVNYTKSAEVGLIFKVKPLNFEKAVAELKAAGLNAASKECTEYIQNQYKVWNANCKIDIDSKNKNIVIKLEGFDASDTNDVGTLQYILETSRKSPEDTYEMWLYQAVVQKVIEKMADREAEFEKTTKEYIKKKFPHAKNVKCEATYKGEYTDENDVYFVEYEVRCKAEGDKKLVTDFYKFAS